MKNNNGFTLVELMITVAMTGIITAVIYAAYTLQQRTTVAQDQVATMQQNIRAASYTMGRELKMAGFDPANSGAGVTVATDSGIRFGVDLNEDGDITDANEDITYGFAAADDADVNGVVDVGIAALRRDTNLGGGLQPIAENIQAIEFWYNIVDDQVTPPAVSWTLNPTSAEIPDISGVTISILARSTNRDSGFVNTQTYTSASGVEWDLNGAAGGTGQPTNDNYRRRLYIATVQCRNLGL